MSAYRSRPAFVLVFLALLVIPQAYAFVRQFRGGFRPFRAAPHRVPLSWDMFAVRIERCDVFWTPPLPTPAGPLARLSNALPRLEWDIALASADEYRSLVTWTCGHFGQPFHASLTCFLPEGKVVSNAIECRR